MAVTYDSAATAHSFGVTSVATGNFTISSSAGCCALVGLWTSASVTDISVSCGGQSGTLIRSHVGSDNRLYLYLVVSPASGSQTASASWTGTANASIGVVTVIGAGGVNNDAASTETYTTSKALEITSASGDLTVTFCGAGTNLPTSDQTRRTSEFGSLDTGPGTGTTTHTWSVSTSVIVVVGCNVQAAATGQTVSPSDTIAAGSSLYAATVKPNQLAHPDEDIVDGGWVTYYQNGTPGNNVDLFQDINDGAVADDTNMIRSAVAPSNDTVTFGLTSLLTPEAGTVKILVRARYYP